MDVILELIWGVPSSKALGNPGVTDPDWEPLNLLTGSNVRLVQENGRSGWVPSNPTLKNDGVRADSALENGTTILASAYGNVTETMQLYLVGTTIGQRAAALRDLYRLSELARDFQEDTQTQPVYLRWQSAAAPAEQFSLVVKIDISFVELDLMNADESPIVTLVIEREPIWRGIAPMDNPKKYAFYSRGLLPTNGSPAATEYNYANLDLISAFGGAASYRSLYQQNIRNYDEVGTTNVNYIDITAANIPGDAPAFALVNFTTQANNLAGLWVARSTQRDYYPANNSNIATQRAKNTFNGGDSTLGGAAIVTSKPIIATGLLSNGSVVNRSVFQGVCPVGAASEIVANWVRVNAQYQNKYMAFIRANLTAGNLAEVSVNLIWRAGLLNVNVERTNPVLLKQAAFGLTYLGLVELNKTARRMGALNGTGVDTTSSFMLQLGMTKTAGIAATLQVWDIILVPYDECVSYAIMNDSLPVAADPVFIDKTGYFGQDGDGSIARQSGELVTRQMRGAAIELMPGVDNRLYILGDYNAPNVTTAHEIRVDIVPCWYGMRDV